MNEKETYINNIKTLLNTDSCINTGELSDLSKDPFLLADIAYDLIESNEIQQAFKLFLYGISLNNNDPDLLNGLGVTLSEMNMFTESIYIFKKALSITPDDAITLANLAGAYWELDNIEKSIFYYSKSLLVNPGIEEVYFNLINLYIEINSLYMAYLTCIQFIKEFPDNPDAKELHYDILLNLAISMN